MELITTCSNCGSQFKWDDKFWRGVGMPDCPACGFNNQTGKKGKQEGPMERAYRKMARDLMKKYGPLKRVEYLSHFPEFNIKFVFESKTVYSGKRRGRYDIHFMSLGYFGEGPRYAKSFLDEAGFSMTSKKIANIRPGAVINLKGRKVVVSYPDESFLIRLLQFMNNIDEKLDSPCLAIKLIRYLFLIIFRGLFILYILIMKKDENE